MPRSAIKTRQTILDAAYLQFRRRGYTRVSLDEMAAAARVTKRTLYYHFRSKDDLLKAVLEGQHELALAAFKTFGKRLSGTWEEIVQAIFDDIAVWSTRPDFAGTGFTRFVIELADLPGHPARVIARRHKALIETQIALALKRAQIPRPEERARELLMLSEGAIVMMLIHRDRSYVAAAAQAAKLLVKQRVAAGLTMRRSSSPTN
jgi:AcrR family transcriptional regulator